MNGKSFCNQNVKYIALCWRLIYRCDVCAIASCLILYPLFIPNLLYVAARGAGCRAGARQSRVGLVCPAASGYRPLSPLEPADLGGVCLLLGVGKMRLF